ncbi:unnamed protein product [Caenorhabditis auriculariae]|uniref:Protein FAM76A n=1 Tax=Caenorhabditis auriculariae TaxID=2777116 RepID=A0A8S1GM74_9PELO|nr:unnamed protein product [Caenorhabditis auriculariae]
MSGLVKKCCNCRVDLPESSSAPQCAKCQKNEQKYGKPTTCKFCQLNAAFHEQKCVYCSHSERKFGPPVSCANCKLNSAFQKHPRAAGPTLCRMCIMQARSMKQSTLAGVTVPPLEKHSSSTKTSGKRKRHEKSSDESAAKMGRAENALAQTDLMHLQQLRDKIARLSSTIKEKEEMILQRDKTIASMKAAASSMERKHREKVEQLQKEKEEAITTVIEKHRTSKSKKT